MIKTQITHKRSYVSFVSPPQDLVLGREDILRALEVCCFQRRMRNVILTGEAGCGKTTIIEEFSRKHTVLQLSVAACVSGTRYRGDYEEKSLVLSMMY